MHVYVWGCVGILPSCVWNLGSSYDFTLISICRMAGQKKRISSDIILQNFHLFFWITYEKRLPTIYRCVKMQLSHLRKHQFLKPRPEWNLQVNIYNMAQKILQKEICFPHRSLPLQHLSPLYPKVDETNCRNSIHHRHHRHVSDEDLQKFKQMIEINCHH